MQSLRNEYHELTARYIEQSKHLSQLVMDLNVAKIDGFIESQSLKTEIKVFFFIN